VLADHGFVGSVMGNCDGQLLGQGLAESFFATLKVEWPTTRSGPRAVAQTGLFESIEVFYNGSGVTRHSGISARGLRRFSQRLR
jgi:hypothetical protein